MIKAREYLQSPIKRDKALPDSDLLAVFSWKILRLPLDLFPNLEPALILRSCELSDWLILSLFLELDSTLAVLASSADTGEKNWVIDDCDIIKLGC